MDRFYANPANQAICWQDAFIVVAQSIARLRFSLKPETQTRVPAGNVFDLFKVQDWRSGTFGVSI